MRLPRAVVTTLALASNCDEDKYARLALSETYMAQSPIEFSASAIRPQFNPRKKTQVRIRTWVFPLCTCSGALFFELGIKEEVYIYIRASATSA